jgi:hypothetical protein
MEELSEMGILEDVDHKLEDWVNKLGRCERSIYELLLQNPDDEYPKEQLGDETGYSASSGGFNNALSRLSTLGLIERNGGSVRLNREITHL